LSTANIQASEFKVKSREMPILTERETWRSIRADAFSAVIG
jgi:hypothetical protein